MKRARPIAFPKETTLGEVRTLLLPSEVPVYRKAGFEIYVGRDIGTGIGVSNRAYQRAGAQVLEAKELWQISEVVFKYKPPTDAEYGFLRKGMHVGAIFHAEGNPALVAALCQRHVTAYSYEFFRCPKGSFPIAVVGGEIAGQMAILHAAYHLQRQYGGTGRLLGRVVGADPANVMVLGYGHVGGSAARLAAQMGANVLVLGTNRAGLRRFASTVPQNVRCAVCTRELLLEELPRTDVLIGAILISTFDTPPIVDEDLFSLLKAGSVVIDVTCGYGSGYLPSVRSHTTLANPTRIQDGVICVKIDNLPAAVPKTASEAMSRHIAPYLVTLAACIYSGSRDPVSNAGMIIKRGRLVHPEVIRHMKHDHCGHSVRGSQCV